MIMLNYREEQIATLTKLLGIVENLYLETEGFLKNGDNQQHWYNRGYANGIIQRLHDYGYRDYVEEYILPDSDDIIAGQEFWAWGKAYLHGRDVGMKETAEIIQPANIDG